VVVGVVHRSSITAEKSDRMWKHSRLTACELVLQHWIDLPNHQQMDIYVLFLVAATITMANAVHRGEPQSKSPAGMLLKMCGRFLPPWEYWTHHKRWTIRGLEADQVADEKLERNEENQHDRMAVGPVCGWYALCDIACTPNGTWFLPGGDVLSLSVLCKVLDLDATRLINGRAEQPVARAIKRRRQERVEVRRVVRFRLDDVASPEQVVGSAERMGEVRNTQPTEEDHGEPPSPDPDHDEAVLPADLPPLIAHRTPTGKYSNLEKAKAEARALQSRLPEPNIVIPILQHPLLPGRPPNIVNSSWTHGQRLQHEMAQQAAQAATPDSLRETALLVRVHRKAPMIYGCNNTNYTECCGVSSLTLVSNAESQVGG
jgi:hypothetical protein